MTSKKEIFLSRVNKSGKLVEGMPDNCWEFIPKNSNYTGKVKLSFNLGNGVIKGISLCAFYYFNGKFPEKRVYSLCHNSLCVRPSHYVEDYRIAHFGEYELEGIRYKPCPICGKDYPRTKKNFYFMGNGTLSCCKTCALEKVKIDRARHWARTLRNEIVRRHNQTGIEVGIDEKFIQKLYEEQGGRCYWSGLEMIPSPINKYPFQPSVDRINNDEGYMPHNVVLCCFSMNMGRNSLPKELFEEFLLKIKKEGIDTGLWK